MIKKNKILDTYKNFERDSKSYLSRNGLNVWSVFCSFRCAWDKHVKNHRNYDLFRNYIDPVYDVVETEFGWEEYIRREFPTNFDTDSFWERYQRERKPEDLIGKRYKSGSFNIKAFGDMCEDAFLMNTLASYETNEYMGYRPVTKAFHLPQLDLKKGKKLDEINLNASFYERRFSHNAEIEVEARDFFPWGFGNHKSKIRAYDIGSLWSVLLKKNTKPATIARVKSARSDAEDIYIPQLQKAREEGIDGIRPLARYLTKKKIISPTGLSKWSPSMIQSILKLEKDINDNLPITKEVQDDHDDLLICEIYTGYVNGFEEYFRNPTPSGDLDYKGLYPPGTF